MSSALSSGSSDRSSSLAIIFASSAIMVGLLVHAARIHELTEKKKKKNEISIEAKKKETVESSLLFLGSGCSTGTPLLACLLDNIPGSDKTNGCQTCKNAFKAYHSAKDSSFEENDSNKDLRGNPSVLIRYCSPKGNDDGNEGDENEKRIVIDVGKTFLQSALRFFPKHGIDGIDSVIITHEHADAFHAGLDELRAVQRLRKDKTNEIIPYSQKVQPIDVYASNKCMPHVRTAYPYLFPKEEQPEVKNDQNDKNGDKVKPVQRYIAQLRFHSFPLELTSSFNCSGLDIVPLPVIHGKDFLSTGFAFGETDWVVYLSDASEIPQETVDYIKRERDKRENGISLLVIDCLRPAQKAGRPMVHFSFVEASHYAFEFKAKRTLLVGISHEISHLEGSRLCKEFTEKTGIKMEMSYDGLEIKGLRL